MASFGCDNFTDGAGTGAPNFPYGIRSATAVKQGYTTTPTAATTTTLTASSTGLQYFTGTTTQTVVLPVVSTLGGTGTQFTIVNLSTGAVTVQSSGGNTVAILQPNQTCVVTSTATSGTDNTVWSYSQRANTLVPGLTSTATAAGTTTLTFTSTWLQQFTGTTTQTVLLPVTSTLTVGQQFMIYNSSTGAVTVQSSGANTIFVQQPNTVAVYTCIAITGTGTSSWVANISPSAQIPGATVTATAAGTTTLTAASPSVQQLTGVTTQTVILPVTSTLALGQQYLIYNSSTGAVTVQSSGANTITILQPGCWGIFTCVAITGTGTSSWAGTNSASQLPTGLTSTATAAGTTTLTVLSTLMQIFTGSTTQTIVLPVTSTLVLGQTYAIVNNSSANLTVQSSGANTIQTQYPSSIGYYTCVSLSGTGIASWSCTYIANMGTLATTWNLYTPAFDARSANGAQYLSRTDDSAAGDEAIDIARNKTTATNDVQVRFRYGATLGTSGSTNGGISAASSTTWQFLAGSDRRLKTNIVPWDFQGALEKMAALSKVISQYETLIEPGVKVVGPVAQDMQKIFPQCVQPLGNEEVAHREAFLERQKKARQEHRAIRCAAELIGQECPELVEEEYKPLEVKDPLLGIGTKNLEPYIWRAFEEILARLQKIEAKLALK